MTLRNGWLWKAFRAVQNPVQIGIRLKSGSN
jgi:hypothetical protein